ncbi:hypothetical protein I7I51_01496 [Histoplasma capsulatum]|uniref:Uncharacterized protein n=1 Tax=Ajellomyces capsulatus TaxID=5037 RepID=A0A8A1MER8_AJECA|nr:predicted protein [Histoplasma mississippiense (nom. inval.)]EDN10324.1 predicted protein [Histoplasma mississippiense (nom. inval.)]QSS64429.1 hypothetical protein I7I51_01496 [Histoplasma capsulatum]
MTFAHDWAPSHFERLCSAIDMIPFVNFEISQRPEASDLSVSESTGLSQGVSGVDLGVYLGADLGSSFTSLLEEDDPSLLGSQNAALSNRKLRGDRARPSDTQNKRKRIANETVRN